MAQQAKELYSGLKKIWPSRRGSFSANDTTSGADNQANAGASEQRPRRPSFSFSAWMDAATGPTKLDRSQSESSRWQQWRRRSRSFGGSSNEEAKSKSRRNGAKKPVPVPATMVQDDSVMVKPTTAPATTTATATHTRPVSRWETVWDDSDSDDEYEDSQRPRTRGFDRRSMSADFDVQPSSQLMSRIWRKLPMQAKLYGNNGKLDLDMQKDRLSFSRSSSYKKEHKTAEIRPSLDEENVFGDKHIHFSKTVAYHPSEDECYVALESYDDVLVRVCGFAAHDQRKTATKIEEFLERSLAFAHRQRTKHGSIVNLSNEEVRMWRRLAKHDWTSEAITTTSEPPPVSKGSSDDEPCRASCSSATVDCADDSDADEQAPEEEEDLYVPEDVCLDELVEVINYCVNFGEELFSLSEVQKLVRSELLVEEDGWI